MTDHDPSNHRGESVPQLARIAFFVFLGIAAFFLIVEHRAHVFGVLPFLLILACPLLHFGMHGRHGHGGSRDAADDDRDAPAGGGHRH